MPDLAVQLRLTGAGEGRMTPEKKKNGIGGEKSLVEEDAYAVACHRSGTPRPRFFSGASSPPIPANMLGIFLGGMSQFSLDS